MTKMFYHKLLTKIYPKCLKKQSMWNEKDILRRNMRIEVMAKDVNKEVLHSCKPAHDGFLGLRGGV